MTLGKLLSATALATLTACATAPDSAPATATGGPPVPAPLAVATEAAPITSDRFVVTNTVDRLADGTLANCRLTDAPSEGACDVWRDGDGDRDGGPALFAREHRPGEALRLSLVVDVRPWTGALQPLALPGQVEQVVLLGGEEGEGCARLGEGGPVMRDWAEVTACPITDDPAAFFATLGDPRPRQSTWTLAAVPM